ncbi:MAG TPA: ATP-binding cassette domain-containing protein [Acidimicrobiales bacterium]|nr:ATP-binding cassette domain-containing protein [Acidimicrobiales bacterium]
MSGLELDRVSKIYRSGTFGGDHTVALREVSFDIAPGEVVSLIGQSGSGKSTLGRVILRLTRLSSGAVRFDGSDVSSLPRSSLREYYRRVQGVFQDPFSSYNPVYKADRVFEMVRTVYFPRDRGPVWTAKVEAALASVALNPGDVLNKYPHQLSGGQQQRLLIARALLLEVKLLVADEIISMLDASTRVDVLNLLVDLKRKGMSVLFITHDLSLGNYISDKAVILRAGCVVEMGDTTKVFGNPQHPYTNSLLSAVPQLHRRWEGSGGDAEQSEAVPVGTLNGAVATFSNARPATASRRSSPAPSPAAVHAAVGAPSPGGGSRATPPRPGSRPSLMDMPDAPWMRRGRRMHGQGLSTIAPAPPLVECEPGHFVAVAGASAL